MHNMRQRNTICSSVQHRSSAVVENSMILLWLIKILEVDADAGRRLGEIKRGGLS